MASLVAWLLAAGALVAAATEFAQDRVVTPDVLLAVHLVGLGFLPLAVAGAALHVLPTLLRTSPDPRLGWIGFAGLLAGPALAFGIAHGHDRLTAAGAVLVGTGALALAVQVGLLVARAPRGRLLLASRLGVGASTVHALLAFAVGPALYWSHWQPVLGVRHDRLVLIHLHLAVLGWLTLLIVTVGRTLVPMLSLAPAEPVRRRPDEEAAIVLGVWVGIAGLAVGSRPLVAAGGVVVLVALARVAAMLVRAARRSRIEGIEGPIAHVLAGVVFLAQAAVLGAVLVGGQTGARRLAVYAILLLVGWAAGVTLGHLGKLLSLSVWTWWPPGPRPKQAELYPRRLWAAEAVLFAIGVEALAAGTLLGHAWLIRVGGIVLVASALAALAGAATTLRRVAP